MKPLSLFNVLLLLFLWYGAEGICAETAQKPYLVLKGTLVSPKPQVGERLQLKIYSKARAPWFFHATRLFIYRKDAVKGCFEAAGLKVIKHDKDPGYDTVELAGWEWFPRRAEAEVLREFSTKGWLPGKYTLVIHVLYYPETGSNGYCFSATTFELTLNTSIESISP